MQQQINFYRPEFHRRRQVFTSATLLQASTTIVLAMLLTFGFAAQKLATMESELEAVGKQEAAALNRLERLAPVISAVSGGKSWQERVDDANRMIEEKQLVLSLVQGSAFGDTRGFSRHLKSLARLDIDGVWLTRIRLSALGDSTSLGGQALRPELVPAYLQYLAEEPPFAAQRFHQFQIDSIDGQTSGNVSFSVTSDTQVLARAGATQ